MKKVIKQNGFSIEIDFNEETGTATATATPVPVKPEFSIGFLASSGKKFTFTGTVTKAGAVPLTIKKKATKSVWWIFNRFGKSQSVEAQANSILAGLRALEESNKASLLNLLSYNIPAEAYQKAEAEMIESYNRNLINVWSQMNDKLLINNAKKGNSYSIQDVVNYYIENIAVDFIPAPAQTIDSETPAPAPAE